MQRQSLTAKNILQKCFSKSFQRSLCMNLILFVERRVKENTVYYQSHPQPNKRKEYDSYRTFLTNFKVVMGLETAISLLFK